MAVLPRATPERLSTLSDGVFAVLITMLVLELRPPAIIDAAHRLPCARRRYGYRQ